MSQSDPDFQNRPKPFSKERTKTIVSKILYFYSIFYVIGKIITVFQGAPAIPYLAIVIPFIILAVIGFKIEKSKNYSWIYIIIGVILISGMWYYELQILGFLQNQLS